MFHPDKAISEINKSCKNYFSESSFRLIQQRGERYIISGDYLSKAVNNYRNTEEEVKVIKWFADFWLYIEIRFEKSAESIPSTFISLSVFQGDDTDLIKKQLFRAEWDNFDDDDTHPQPHWHIFPVIPSIKSFSEFIETVDADRPFSKIIDDVKSRRIDLTRIHFAMNGQWSTNGSHFHKIRDENTMKYWFQGLLGHIKSQLEYVKKH
ncbi:hypothetical protein L0128_21395 [candidate division KSB1 bacterium]|nr:hypothetical protein [candidate division KSB1 bacterium]